MTLWCGISIQVGKNEMDIKEIFNAVSSIEQDIFESTCSSDLNITLVTNGVITKVSFNDIELWSNEDDSCLYQEPIEECLRRRLNEELNKISSIRV